MKSKWNHEQIAKEATLNVGAPQGGKTPTPHPKGDHHFYFFHCSLTDTQRTKEYSEGAKSKKKNGEQPEHELQTSLII